MLFNAIRKKRIDVVEFLIANKCNLGDVNEVGNTALHLALIYTHEEIASLRHLFTTYSNDGISARIDEYSETNISFHQALFKISHCSLLSTLTENLFIHMRSIRMRTIYENDRATQSIQDHLQIIEALEAE